MKIQIVDDVAAIERRWSIRLAKIGAAVMAGWGALAGLGLTAAGPAWLPQVIAGTILVCITGAAYLKQDPPADCGHEHEDKADNGAHRD